MKAHTRLLATSVDANSEVSIYALPPGHNLDDGALDTGLDSEDDGPRPQTEVDDPMVPELNAASRLLHSSIYNSVQEPEDDSRLSSVQSSI
jgi:hypothetical protein